MGRLGEIDDLPRLLVPALRAPWDYVPRQTGWTMTAWQAVAISELIRRIDSSIEHAASEQKLKAKRLQESSSKIRTISPTRLPVQVIRVGDYDIDMGAMTLAHSVSGDVKLSTLEFTLLATLAQHLGKVVSFADLKRALWPQDSNVPTNRLQVIIGYLRRKVSLDITIRRGVGYVLERPGGVAAVEGVS